MTAGEPAGTRPKARQRSIYCSSADRVLIGRRAEEAVIELLALHGRLRATWG